MPEDARALALAEWMRSLHREMAKGHFRECMALQVGEEGASGWANTTRRHQEILIHRAKEMLAAADAVDPVRAAFKDANADESAAGGASPRHGEHPSVTYTAVALTPVRKGFGVFWPPEYIIC